MKNKIINSFLPVLFGELKKTSLKQKKMTLKEEHFLLSFADLLPKASGQAPESSKEKGQYAGQLGCLGPHH